MTERHCWQCRAEILECMGSVHAGSFLRAMLSQDPNAVVYELCPRCATRLANTVREGDAYPHPPTV